ncbi:MAG TPA: MinD/ParA family protein [Anaerolineae bacterium]|nr:MinD/ParA family protein [Anaerolineae bacterium]
MNVKSYQFKNAKTTPPPEPLAATDDLFAPPQFRSRVIAVSSGKGGVGKTNIAVNLGLTLAKRGIRVALLDADLGTANVDVMMGLQPEYHLQHLITGQRSLAEILVETPSGLKIIPGASGLPDLADLPDAQRDVLLRALMGLDGTVDLLLIDTGAGVGRNVVQFILSAGEMLLVTTPEPTAVTDAYALVKVLAGYHLPISIKLVVNNAQPQSEGEAVAQRLATVAEQFLGRAIEPVGVLPRDKNVPQAVRHQTPLVEFSPYSPMAVALNRLAERLWSDVEIQQVTGISQFFRKIMALRSVITG